MLTRLRVGVSDDVFIFGFSQGGHSALAVHRDLERASFRVTASAAVGGVFDVERFFRSSIADETTVTLPLYVSYVLLAYDDIYDVFGHPSDVFRPRYAATIPGLFDMQHYWDDVLRGPSAHGARSSQAGLLRSRTEQSQQPTHSVKCVLLRGRHGLGRQAPQPRRRCDRHDVRRNRSYQQLDPRHAARGDGLHIAGSMN